MKKKNAFDKAWDKGQTAWFILDVILFVASAAFIGYCFWTLVLQ